MFILYCCVTLLKGSNLGLCPHKRLVITEPKKNIFLYVPKFGEWLQASLKTDRISFPKQQDEVLY